VTRLPTTLPQGGDYSDLLPSHSIIEVHQNFSILLC
jgi:hypothetical protein